MRMVLHEIESPRVLVDTTLDNMLLKFRKTYIDVCHKECKFAKRNNVRENIPSKMVNETQSFVQYKDKAHSLSTEVIQKVIGTETYQQKLVQGWVDSIGQEIVNKLRV
jgi:ribosomal protein S24E